MMRILSDLPLRFTSCEVCKDGQGFYARPCPGCTRQKPLLPHVAAAYRVPAGTTLTEETARKGLKKCRS